MQSYQNVYRDGAWQTPLSSLPKSQLVLLFGDRQLASDADIGRQLDRHFPSAHIVGCSTSGEIHDTDIYDDSLCLCSVEFSPSTRIEAVYNTDLSAGLHSACRELVAEINPVGLRYVLVLSDGQVVNGTELIENLQACLPAGTPVSGGLAGDGTRFKETVLWCNGAAFSQGIILIAFYGEKLRVGHGSVGGWDPFGPERTITKSRNNVLFSLDGKPALELYKQYLGQHAENLPASALLFPLSLIDEHQGCGVIRTILNVDEENSSMTFAGDIPEGRKSQLMHANVERLLDGANDAAQAAYELMNKPVNRGIALLISCVGRRLVLKTRTEEELEVIRDQLPDSWAMCGFYSYGEISPGPEGCTLHNQTMTVTLISELDE